MRILTFLHSFEPGGVERVALRLVARWRSLGVDAPLFVGREDGPLRAELASHLPYSVDDQPPGGSAWCETLWMIARLPAEIRRQRPDILFCAGSTYTVVAVAMKLLLGRSCPPIVAKISNDLTREDMPAPARLAWRTWLRLQSLAVDSWIVMDDSMVADTRAIMGAARLTVIPDPAIDESQIATGRVRPRYSTRPGRRFAAVGRLAPQKNYPLMLEAFASGASVHDTLTLYGSGPLERRLRRLAYQLGIDARIAFAGHVPDAAARLRDQDILLLSSSYEGVPAVLVEALAQGMPIIATSCGPGVDGLLDHGRLGMVVARERGALATAIGAAEPRSIVDPAATAQARRFTIEASATRYLAAFADVAAGDRVATKPLRRLPHSDIAS